jgi:hypothetical protein
VWTVSRGLLDRLVRLLLLLSSDVDIVLKPRIRDEHTAVQLV